MFSVLVETLSVHEAVIMSSGGVFHSCGPAEATDRSPTVTRRDGRTVPLLNIVNIETHDSLCPSTFIEFILICTICLQM